MKSDERIMIPLRYGRTDGTNLPHMTKGKLLTTGYNSTNGLVYVCEDNGKLHYEGIVNIEGELPKILTEEGVPNQDEVEQYVTKRSDIMRLETDLRKSRKDSEIDSKLIESKIDQYKRELVAESHRIDSKVDQYIMRAYDNSENSPKSNPTPILEVLIDNR